MSATLPLKLPHHLQSLNILSSRKNVCAAKIHVTFFVGILRCGDAGMSANVSLKASHRPQTLNARKITQRTCSFEQGSSTVKMLRCSAKVLYCFKARFTQLIKSDLHQVIETRQIHPLLPWEFPTAAGYCVGQPSVPRTKYQVPYQVPSTKPSTKYHTKYQV